MVLCHMVNNEFLMSTQIKYLILFVPTSLFDRFFKDFQENTYKATNT